MATAATIAENELALRDSMWPDAGDREWRRRAYGGFITLPKTLPLLSRAMDEMSKNFPVSQTYVALWSFTWDNAFVRLKNLDEIAFAAGFTGQRGVRTLQDRLKRLDALGFIDLKASGSNRMAFAFLPNPHVVLFELQEALTSKTGDPDRKALAQGLQEGTWNAFLGRAQEIGCKDVRALLDARSGKTAAAAAAATITAPRKRLKLQTKPSKGL